MTHSLLLSCRHGPQPSCQDTWCTHAQEPLGLLERQAEDAGPETKSRRRPAPVDPNPPKARLHHAETQDALKDEVARRKGC